MLPLSMSCFKCKLTALRSFSIEEWSSMKISSLLKFSFNLMSDVLKKKVTRLWNSFELNFPSR